MDKDRRVIADNIIFDNFGNLSVTRRKFFGVNLDLSHVAKGSFNNHVDKILMIFDPSPLLQWANWYMGVIGSAVIELEPM